MFSLLKPARVRAIETSRRALSNASEGPPSWACQSPATTTADQSENEDACAQPAPASHSAATRARSRAATRLLLVVGERRRDRRTGRLGQDAAFGIEQLALGERHLPAPAD